MVRALFGARQDGRGHVYGSACGRWVALARQSDPAEQALVSAGAEGGLVLVPAPGGAPLSDEEAGLVADLVYGVAAKWGGPVRVSFFWPAGGELVVTQVMGMDPQDLGGL